MNFDDTPSEAEFRARARAWINQNKFPIETDGDRDDFEPVRRWQAMKQAAGWGALSWPKEYGGAGATDIEATIFAQEEQKAGMNMLSVALTITLGMAAATIMARGTPEQKAKHLERIARGEEVWCQLFSEPIAGSDLAGIKTKAERDGDDWIITGQKVWTSLAHHSDWAILLTRSDPNVPKHKGLTYFLLDMRSPGVEIRPIRQASGESEFNEVFFDGVRLPDSNRVGAPGEGWSVAMTTLMSERMVIANVLTTNFDEMWDLASETMLEEHMALEAGGIRRLMADWHVWSQGLKNFSLRLQSDLSQGKTPGPEASVSKVALAAQRQRYLAEALDLMDIGGNAASARAEQGWHFDFLRVIGNRLEGGTDEILRNVIAERVLGLPAEPRVDKGVPFNEVPTS